MRGKEAGASLAQDMSATLASGLSNEERFR